MYTQRTLLASAVLSAFASLPSLTVAQNTDNALPEVTVTATPFNTAEGAQILAPAKVLSGDELKSKVGSSLGETLSHELGVFAAEAFTPYFRNFRGSFTP